MTRLVGRLAALLALFVVATTLPSLGTTALAAAPRSSAGARADGDPAAGEPAVGTCYKLNVKDLAAESVTKAPVDCAEAHTSMVLATKRIAPSYFDDPAKVSDLIASTCYKNLAKVLGGTDQLRAWTSYSWSFFIPTDAEQEQGASWASCHVRLIGDNVAKNLPKGKPFLSGKKTISDKVKRCITAKNYYTTCDDGHAYRAMKPFDLSSFVHGYPSKKEATQVAAQECPKRSGRNGVFTYPNVKAWMQGWHQMICYKKTTS